MSLGAISYQDVTIAVNAAISLAIKLLGRRLIGIQQPVDCEGVSWALYACDTEDGTYVQVFNAIQEATGAAPVTAPWEVSKSATAAQILMLPDAFQYHGLPFIKLHSADSGASDTNQTTAGVTIRVFVEEEQNGYP